MPEGNEEYLTQEKFNELKEELGRFDFGLARAGVFVLVYKLLRIVLDCFLHCVLF